MNGADYIALVPIFMPGEGRMVRVAEAGQSCERVPAESLGPLLKRGKIRKLEKKEQADG
jgi:hypothetical protein